MKTLVACLLIPLAAATYIESVAANVDAASRKQDKFVPLVAFECGYRNRYMGEDGHWKTDDNRYATCQTGKLDILKYCKKSYPRLNVTNIVEYSHEVTLDRWCREEGSPCHYTRTTRPYQCIVGEFRSEALQVPHDCRFSHVSNRHACNDYNHWKLEAATQCANKKVEGRPLSVRSFAVLEPCGLDLFTGVEFVCCPSVALNKDKVEKVAMTTAKPVTATEEDEDDDDEYSDEDDSEDEEESTEADKKPTAAVGQDPYFTHNEPAKEHENFKEAEERLEKSYHEKINKVMKEWADLEAKYKKMAAHDPSGAAAFKTDMTSRFQKTVASLEDENKEAKKELETVHEERVQATLNEKKLQATHDYRQALALHVGTANKHNVLKTLKTYIRAEEKDRLHMLNRYRHVLRVDQSQAAAMKPVLLHRLRYIDLRINGTMAMLRDFPDLEKNVRPIATTFWTELRRENTPELTDAELDSLEGLAPDTRNKKLVDMYKKSFDKLHPSAKLDVKAPAATTPAPTTTEKTKVLDSSVDSEEEDDEYYEDEDDEEVRKRPAVVVDTTKPSIHVEPIVHSIVKPAPVEEKKVVAEKKDAATQTSAEDDESTSSESASTEEDDDDEEEDEDDKSSELKELRVDIEPIIKERPIEERRPLPAYLRQERLIQTRNDAESSSIPASSSPLFLIAAAAVLTLSVFAVAAIRRKRQHHGFIEVDVCTPEERHVSGMQVTGYENPTYSFFDSKA